MKPLAFLRSDPSMRALERLALCAGCPLSLHYVDGGIEGPLILGWGRCEACRYVASIPGGSQWCRESRVKASEAALDHEGPLPHICHMGFVLLAAPALPQQQFVLTLGPYCPSEESRSLEYDVSCALSALQKVPVDQLPFSLNDVHRAPAASMPALMEWTLESLYELWQETEKEKTPIESIDENLLPKKRTKRRIVPRASIPAEEVAMAVLSNNKTLSRTLCRGSLAEVQTGKRIRMDLCRARGVHLASAVLEWVQRSGMDASAGWSMLEEAVKDIHGAATEQAVLDTVQRLLSEIKPQVDDRDSTASQEEKKPLDPRLTRIILERLTKGVQLKEVATALGESPSTITHRLQRKYGMSFTEYVNRLRMDRAKELLRRTQLTVTKIALRVGVEDQSNFGKLFKKFENMSPSDYRERFGRKR